MTNLECAGGSRAARRPIHGLQPSSWSNRVTCGRVRAVWRRHNEPLNVKNGAINPFVMCILTLSYDKNGIDHCAQRPAPPRGDSHVYTGRSRKFGLSPLPAPGVRSRSAARLSPGCRAVELSRLRRGAVEALSRPCLSSLSSYCRVLVEPVEPDSMCLGVEVCRGLSRSVEVCRGLSSSCRAILSSSCRVAVE